MGKLFINGGLKVQGRVVGSGDDEGIVIDYADNNWAGLILGSPSAKRSVFYLSSSGLPRWRYNDGSNSYDITHPSKSGTIALTSDIPTTMAWSSITGKPSTFTPSSHTHSYQPIESTTFSISNTTYVSVRTPNRTAAMYYEFWDSVGWAGIRAGDIYDNNNRVLSAGNYTSYTVTKTGSGASGTWGINISGNASSAGYLSVYTNYTSQSALDGFLSAGVLRYATISADAVPFNNDGTVISVGWSGSYGSQIWLDDGSGPARMAVRNRNGGTAWNGWRHCIMSSSYTYYGGTLPTSGQQTGDVFFKT